MQMTDLARHMLNVIEFIGLDGNCIVCTMTPFNMTNLINNYGKGSLHMVACPTF